VVFTGQTSHKGGNTHHPGQFTRTAKDRDVLKSQGCETTCRRGGCTDKSREPGREKGLELVGSTEVKESHFMTAGQYRKKT